MRVCHLPPPDHIQQLLLTDLVNENVPSNPLTETKAGNLIDVFVQLKKTLFCSDFLFEIVYPYEAHKSFKNIVFIC